MVARKAQRRGSADPTQRLRTRQCLPQAERAAPHSDTRVATLYHRDLLYVWWNSNVSCLCRLVSNFSLLRDIRRQIETEEHTVCNVYNITSYRGCSRTPNVIPTREARRYRTAWAYAIEPRCCIVKVRMRYFRARCVVIAFRSGWVEQHRSIDARLHNTLGRPVGSDGTSCSQHISCWVQTRAGHRPHASVVRTDSIHSSPGSFVQSLAQHWLMNRTSVWLPASRSGATGP
ncbi:hypothetical protein C8Q73DRAFT_122466 [Cubamyces lactineus]|nr:hypothetical protein C8Q73DRAFT_122466 [Cubamyces lactineus]